MLVNIATLNRPSSGRHDESCLAVSYETEVRDSAVPHTSEVLWLVCGEYCQLGRI